MTGLAPVIVVMLSAIKPQSSFLLKRESLRLPYEIFRKPLKENSYCYREQLASWYHTVLWNYAIIFADCSQDF